MPWGYEFQFLASRGSKNVYKAVLSFKHISDVLLSIFVRQLIAWFIPQHILAYQSSFMHLGENHALTINR